jgi:hypothetical protein
MEGCHALLKAVAGKGCTVAHVGFDVRTRIVNVTHARTYKHARTHEHART